MRKNATFEQAMNRLDEIAAALDGGEASLEQSLKLFSEGAELIAFCEKKLEDASLLVEKLFPEEVPDEGGV